MLTNDDAVSAALDEYQRKVVESDAQTIRVIAAAGSGKTATLVQRVDALVRTGTDPRRILVLTFDRSASGELKDKIAAIAGQRSYALQRSVSTVNAWAYRTLKRHFPDEIRVIIPRSDDRKLMRSALRELHRYDPRLAAVLGTEFDILGFLKYVGRLKSHVFDPRRPRVETLRAFILSDAFAAPLLTHARDDLSRRRAADAIIRMFTIYDQLMIARAVMDFDDQKLRCLIELRKNTEIRKLIQQSYDEVIVDEFQDINQLDFELIHLLSRQSRLIIVGDDDQAIYGFRGSSSEFLIEFSALTKRLTESYELQINYR